MPAANLLARAQQLYDDPSLPFAVYAREKAWRGGFASGADWMRLALSHIRQTSIPAVGAPYNLLGLIKYGLASLGALLYLALVARLRLWGLGVGFILVFYAIEAQLVFLFPLAIDGCTNPLHASRDWTKRAGGTWHVMMIVIRFAVVMMFGGFLGKGFVRSWALGCLGVVLWYEEVRHAGHRST
jgi:hypothetical protein